ncbi:hypothetical protein HPB48_015205 [Haemaphysalis longicornis]|uniref:Uncharacterized protein n=1 Tax=Haemaphysalis longicornis TaxID=44386 RepID=A0A9J6FK54_HAELO|nr:hypothetical protein HPB48_015205 [Haemaphysalis longicornis]
MGVLRWAGEAPMAERPARIRSIDCAGRRCQWQSVSIRRPVEQPPAQNQCSLRAAQSRRRAIDGRRSPPTAPRFPPARLRASEASQTCLLPPPASSLSPRRSLCTAAIREPEVLHGGANTERGSSREPHPAVPLPGQAD